MRVESTTHLDAGDAQNEVGQHAGTQRQVLEGLQAAARVRVDKGARRHALRAARVRCPRHPVCLGLQTAALQLSREKQAHTIRFSMQMQ